MRRLERMAGALIAIATVAVVLGSLALVIWTRVGLRSEVAVIRHTRSVVDALEAVREELHDLDGSARDYVLTGDGRYLDLYRSRLPEAASRLDLLRSLVAAVPPQLDRFRRLEGLVGQETDLLARLADFVGGGHRDLALALLTPGDEQALSSGVDAALDEMRAFEQAELQSRRNVADVTTARLIEGALVVGGATLAILILGFLVLRSQQRQRRSAEAELRASERLLNSIFTTPRSASRSPVPMAY
jgi:CHASE3 domain sensor protein